MTIYIILAISVAIVFSVPLVVKSYRRTKADTNQTAFTKRRPEERYDTNRKSDRYNQDPRSHQNGPKA